MNIKYLIVICFLGLVGCESTYYNTMEKFGVHKREILVDRVKEARDSQQDAQQQFRSALDQFKLVTDYDGGKLETAYRRLNSEFETSEKAANTIRERISSVDTVAKALFKEWEDELSLYSSSSLRRDSQTKLNTTQKKYTQLLSAMQRAESKLEPVLSAMRDQVLYLKHNLNTQAIQSLKGDVISINRDVDSLLAAMELAIHEADSFIEQMKDS